MSNRGPLTERNLLIKENRVAEYTSPNLALGMAPVEFGAGTSRWRWNAQPPAALNPFGTLQGGYLAVFIDELLSTAIGSVLEDGEWAMTAEFKINFLRALAPTPLMGSARVMRRTRTLAFLEAHIETEDGQVAVTASSTWAVMKR
ncbi:MAG: hypothetical protein QOG61_938 [Candidatus Binataceae bacterium]|nr:hypothetical protein [Candidatus Binataceae bacterium]